MEEWPCVCDGEVMLCVFVWQKPYVTFHETLNYPIVCFTFYSSSKDLMKYIFGSLILVELFVVFQNCSDLWYCLLTLLIQPKMSFS